MATDKTPKGGKPESQKRGRTSGPDLSKKEGVSKEELDEELNKFKEEVEETPFSPHEMGRNYPVQDEKD